MHHRSHALRDAPTSRVARVVLITMVCAGMTGGWASGGAKLDIRVSPAASMAPADVMVRATVESDGDNRVLEVQAESYDFYTSSQVPLNGAQSPRLNLVRFAALPPGEYEVRAILVGSQGRRALVTRSILVLSAPGR